MTTNEQNCGGVAPAIEIGADGIDVKKVVAEIRATVADKRARGVYDDEIVARAERNNLLLIQDDAGFMEQYLRCLRQIVPVDINDFEIVEKRGFMRPLMILLKKTIWKLLKFYTYRLWSQQNQTNGVLLAAIEIMDRRHKSELEALRKEIALLKGGSSQTATSQSAGK